MRYKIDYVERRITQDLNEYYEVTLICFIMSLCFVAIIRFLTLIDNRIMMTMFLLNMFVWVILLLGGTIKIKYG